MYKRKPERNTRSIYKDITMQAEYADHDCAKEMLPNIQGFFIYYLLIMRKEKRKRKNTGSAEAIIYHMDKVHVWLYQRQLDRGMAK